jgi:hypothetical protein
MKINTVNIIVWLFIALNLCFVSKLNSQTYLEYNYLNGSTTSILFSVISTGSSANTSGNQGVLVSNTGSDTGSSFFPLNIVNDPSSYPWRIVVQIGGGVTGVLIDPYHILTAGHVVDFSPYFVNNTSIVPAYALSDSPFGYCKPELLYKLSDFLMGSSTDIAIIKLDRPIGALVGWAGYGYNNDNNFFLTNNQFLNPSYPSAGLFDASLLYNWKGIFDFALTDYIYSFRQGISGMSGSPAYTKVGTSNVTYGILLTSGIKFNRITPQKFDGINKIIQRNTPSEFDMIPLYTEVFPKILKKGNQPDSINFTVLNYSSASVSNANITAGIYISQDSIITTSDSLIATYNYTKSFAPKSSVILNQKVNLPAIGKEAGTYWVGVIISGDNNTSNNTVSKYDAAKIIINNTNNFRINGTITSTQSNNGISGVKLSGFPTSVVSDYKGYYETEVPAGWSGTVTASKPGFTPSPSQTVYSNVNNGTLINYSIAKNTFTVSGYAKSPIGQKGVWGVKLTGLAGQPVTDTSGYFSTTVFEGWSGYVNATKQGWDMKNAYYAYSKINSNQSVQISAGFTVAGIVYKPSGEPIQNVKMEGFPGAVCYTNINGEYIQYLDSGFSGTVRPVYAGSQFSPTFRTYSNLHVSYYYHDYQELPMLALNVKVFLSGAYAKGTDSMKSALKQHTILPASPNTEYSNKDTKFTFIAQSGDSVMQSFWNNSANIVDWICVEILDQTKKSIDTVICLLRNDGKLLNLSGDSLVRLDAKILTGSYYIVIRHRNHIAVMSANPVTITTEGVLYDFTTGLDKYYGNDAKLLKSGLYGMYSGDANFDGKINANDFNIYEEDSNNGISGYKISDFNIDGYVTALDFNLLAPNKRNSIITKIPKI